MALAGRNLTETRRESETLVCSACGAVATRELANYCLVCGKVLAEDYQPLDSLRSSNRMQGQAFLLENQSRETPDLFAVNRNSVAQTAWASCVYSMVPYIGVVFIPFTFAVSVLGIGISLIRPRSGGGKMSAASFALSFLVLAIQLLLWWLLYIVPELGRTI